MAVRTSTGFAEMSLGPMSFNDIFDGGSIAVYTGTQPETADDAATGTLLGRITLDGGAWTAGDPANGLLFDRIGRYALKRVEDSWVLKGSSPGLAGWARLVGNAPDSGDISLSLPRIDMAVGLVDDTGDAQLRLPNPTIASGSSIEILQWFFLI